MVYNGKSHYLKEWRLYRGLTQAHLAQLIPMSKSHLCHIEGFSRRYNQDILENIARVLQCNPAQLLIPPPRKID